MAKNNFTPDRALNPPDDDNKYAQCDDCCGEGKILCQSDEDEETDQFEFETCPTCGGDGVIEREEDEDDW